MVLLPHASLSLVSLSLSLSLSLFSSFPRYSSTDICFEKLVYAMENCTTMEDYRQNSGEGFNDL